MSWISTRRLQYFYNKIKENYYNKTQIDTTTNELKGDLIINVCLDSYSM